VSPDALTERRRRREVVRKGERLRSYRWALAEMEATFGKRRPCAECGDLLVDKREILIGRHAKCPEATVKSDPEAES